MIILNGFVLTDDILDGCTSRSKPLDGWLANLLLLLLLLKKVGSARIRERDVHHISPKTPATQ